MTLAPCYEMRRLHEEERFHTGLPVRGHFGVFYVAPEDEDGPHVSLLVGHFYKLPQARALRDRLNDELAVIAAREAEPAGRP